LCQFCEWIVCRIIVWHYRIVSSVQV
jgi:hypothetical protein